MSKTTVFILLCITVLAFVAYPPAPVHAQGGFNLIGQFGGRTNGLTVEGDTAYVIMGSRLATLDVSDPAAPLLIGKSNQLPNAQFPTAIDVEGEVAYITGGNDGLIIVDISDPTFPTYASSFDTGGRAEHVQVVENVAYVTGSSRGLVVVDVSNPTSPALLSTFNADERRVKVRVVDSVAYIIKESSNELLVVDVSDPAEPILLNTHTFTESQQHILDIQIAEDVTYLILGRMEFDECGPLGIVLDSVLIVDMSDLAVPVQLGSFDLTGYGWYDYYSVEFDVVDNVAYILSQGNGLEMVDVGDPAAAVTLGTFGIHATWEVVDVHVVGDVAYIADWRQGLLTVDVSDAAAPSKVDRYDVNIGGKGIDVVGDIAYIADGYIRGLVISGLVIVDISDPALPLPLGRFDQDVTGRDGDAMDVQVVDDVAYVAYSLGGLATVDVSDPTAPYLIDYFTLDREIYNSFDTSYTPNVHVVGNVAYFTDNWSSYGLTLIDVSDPSALSLISLVDTGNTQNSLDVHVVDDIAYVSDGRYNKLTVVDVSNPYEPMIVSSVSNDQMSSSLYIANNKAYIANGKGGLEIFDVIDSANPIPLGTFHFEGSDAQAVSVHVVDHVAYVLFDCIACDDRLAVIDVSQPNAPALLDYIDIDGTPLNVYVEDDVVYVSVSGRGMFLLEHTFGDAVPVIHITIGD